jgi:hypothetical protein
MRNDMRLLKLGSKLCLSLALVLISGCRNSQPPKIEVCILDGFGGGDCVAADGSQLYRAPSQMKDYWATSQPDEANFASWCYDASSSTVKAGMADIEARAKP